MKLLTSVNFQIHDDVSPDEGDIPDSAKSFHVKAKSVAMVVTALTALIASIASLVKSMDTSLDEESYKALSSAIERVSQDNTRNHEDIGSLQRYLEADREARKTAVEKVARETPLSVVLPPVPGAKKKDKEQVRPVLPPVPPPAPVMRSDPGPVRPPSFEEVKEAAKE